MAKLNDIYSKSIKICKSCEWHWTHETTALNWFLVSREMRVLISRSVRWEGVLITWKDVTLGTHRADVFYVSSVLWTQTLHQCAKLRNSLSLWLWLSRKEVKDTENTSQPMISLYPLFMRNIPPSFKLKLQANSTWEMKPGTLVSYLHPWIKCLTQGKHFNSLPCFNLFICK